VSWDSDALRTPATAYAQTLPAILKMRLQSTIILTLISLNSFGQIEFKNDSVRNLNYGHIIGDLASDTIQFTFRFWKEVERIPGTFLEFTLSDNKWSYRTGYIDFNKNELIVKEKDHQHLNLDSIWNELTRLQILSIKRQTESKWKGISEKGQNFTVRTNRETYDRNGIFYTIEFIDNHRYKRISYVDPEGLIKTFGQIPATSTDHEQIVKIANLLSATFDIDKIMRQQLHERFSKTKKTN
jgi:hypothetical protein